MADDASTTTTAPEWPTILWWTPEHPEGIPAALPEICGPDKHTTMSNTPCLPANPTRAQACQMPEYQAVLYDCASIPTTTIVVHSLPRTGSDHGTAFGAGILFTVLGVLLVQVARRVAA